MSSEIDTVNGEASASDAADILTKELAKEQKHVDRVYEQLDVLTESARNVEAEAEAKFKTDRSDWMREEDGTAIFERDAFAYQAAKRLAVLDAEHDGLVFGRLDLTEEEIRYIGRLGVRDDDYEPLVIDWRAPAAEPFYRATASNPMEVVRRRVLRCRGEKVVGIEDDLLDESAGDDLVVIGEGALMASLKRARGPHMKDIVATIQAEQDEAIRAPYQGVTLISGGPGTGKTVVALHRAAYLLYTHRKRLEQGGVLVVGPSDLFVNYIARVLPSLGENAVALRAVGDVPGDVLGFTSARAENAQAAILKGSMRMLPVLRAAVNEPLVSGPELNRLRVSIKGEVLTLEQDELNKIRRAILLNNKLNQAKKAAQQALLDALWAKLPEEIAALLDIDREIFDEKITDQASYTMFLNAWWPMLSPEQVLARLADPKFLNSIAHGHMSDEEEGVLTDSLTHARGYVPDSGQPRPDWSMSDMALLDELAHMLGPVPASEQDDPLLFLDSVADANEIVTISDKLRDDREIDETQPRNYSHVLVDECQDITPMQWRMLRRRGPQASWTLVGDPAQSSYPVQEESDRAIRDLIGRAPMREFRLSTNYRSPTEIMDLAGKVVRAAYPDAVLPNSVRETGVEPLLLSVIPDELAGELKKQIMNLSQQVAGSISLITAPDDYRKFIELVEQMKLPEEVDQRVVVITALQSKGLEFDATIVISPDDIVEQTPGGERVLYVALTRPTQRLVTIDLSGKHTARWRRTLTEVN